MKTTRSRFTALLGLVGSLALWSSPTAFAQQGEAQSAVFVRDSSAAQDKIALAQRMERLKEWDTAAQVYQEVIDQYGQRVLPIHKNQHGITDRYVSVSTVIQDRLGSWPDDGRAVYLNLFEPSARIALEQAGDDDTALGVVANRYFTTESGRIAALRLFDRQFEDALFAGAGVLGDRLLTHHPDLADQAPMLMLRTSIAWKFAGDDARAANMADRLDKEFPGSKGKVGGVEVQLNDWLKSALTKPLVAPAHTSKWNTTFGGPDRTAIAYETKLNGELSQLGLIASIPLGIESQSGSTDSITEDEFNDGAVRSSSETFDSTGSQTGVMPVADGDELFINDNSSIRALSLVTGEPLAGWATSWPTTNGRFVSQNQPIQPCVQSGLTLTNRFVVAILDQPPPMQVRYPNAEYFTNATRVVCLDRSTGVLRWQLNMSALVSDDDSLKATHPVGTPLVVNGRVYVATRGGRSNQFEDVFLVCLDLEDGRMLWNRHLMSGSSPAQMHIPLRPAAPAAIYPAYAEGRIYVASEIGAAAALNEADGSIVWLSLFERPLGQFNPRMQNSASMYEQLPAFVANPPMISRGRLWFVGTGDQTLYCFDTTDGSIMLSVDLRTITPKDSTNQYWTLCGIDDQTLVLASDRFVVSLDRTKIESGSSGEKSVLWSSILANESGVALAGRPMVTADSIYVPTGVNLRQIDRQRARVVGTYPPRGAWRAGEGGNVLLAGDSVVIAGPGRVRIYSDQKRILERLQAEAQSDPTSPWPRLRMAQASFRSNHYLSALGSLDKAVELASVNGSLSGPQGDSILVTANSMAQFFWREKDSSANRDELIRRSFDILDRAADEPAERAAFLLQRARTWVESSPAEAINLLQQILADPVMDSIPVTGTQSFSTGEVARRMIQEIVQSRGAILMQSIDARAKAELDEAIKANDFEQIERVARSYPLSPASNDALNALAEHYESSGNTRAAMAIHQKLIHNQPDAKRSLSLEALARLNLNESDEALALAYLKHLRAIAGDSPPQQATIEKLEDSLRADELKRLPELKFNERAPGGSIARERITEVKDVQELVIPEWGYDHPKRVIARMSGNRICAFEAGKVEPIWSVSSAIQSDVQCFWNQDSVTITGAQAIERVNKNGKLAWQLRVEQLKTTENEPAIVDSDNWLRATRNTAAGFPVARESRETNLARQQRLARDRRALIRVGGAPGNFEADADPPAPGQPEQFDQVAISSRTLFASTTNGRIVAIDLQKGKVNWTRAVSDRAPQWLVFSGAVVGLVVNDASSSRLVMLDPASGEVVHTLVVGDGQGNRLVNLGSDGAGLLVALTNNQLIGFDTLIDPRRPSFETVVASMNAMDASLARTTRPHQIAFSRDRFAVLIDSDTDAQRIGLYESNTGQPVTNLDPTTNQKIAVSLPVVPQPNVISAPTLRIVGDRLYVWTMQSLAGYSVADPTSTPWSRRTAGDDPSMIANFSLPIARDLLVAITYRPGRSTPTIETFSRAVVRENLESGQILDMVDLDLPIAMTTRWLAVDGGLYAKTTNGRLVFLPASNK